MASKDRHPYKTATELTQAFLDECADNLTNQLEMICEIETPSGTIYVSDRNKYVGERFYEARMQFPTISRTIGEWLSEEIEFSTIELELNNADGAYNHILQGGAGFGGWVGRSVSLKLGLRDVASTYREIFGGSITEVGGVGRTTKSIRIMARNRWDKLLLQFPTTAFTIEEFPLLENDKVNTAKPYVLGDWTTGLTDPAQVPAIVVNGGDPQVYDGLRDPVQVVVSVNPLAFLDTAKVYLRRGSDVFLLNSADILSVAAGNNAFSIKQRGVTLITPPGGEEGKFEFSTGDEFFVQVRAPQLDGAYRDNAVEQAREILKVYGGLTSADFTAEWDTLRAKATPAQSAIANIKSRVWVQEPQVVIAYALSLLEQVRCEAFVNAAGKLGLRSVHLEDFVASPPFTLRTWDVERGSFQPNVDERTNFNRARGAFAYNPATNENSQTTGFWKNEASITQVGKAIDRQLVFPNLFVRSDVEAQVVEVLRIASAFPETISCTVTWRALLLELGDFVKVSVDVGAVRFKGVPAMVRYLGYNPQGLKLELRLWSFQMVPFPGWAPGYAGIVGGTGATIVPG